MVKVPWGSFLIAVGVGFLACWLVIVPGANKRAAADLASYNAATATLGSQLADARSTVAATLASLDDVKGQLTIANHATAAASADASQLRATQAQRDANDKRLAVELAASLAGAKSSLDIYNVCDAVIHAIFDRSHPSAGNKGPSG